MIIMKAEYKGIKFEGTPVEVVKAIGLFIWSEKSEKVAPPQPPTNLLKPSMTLTQIFALDDELMRGNL